MTVAVSGDSTDVLPPPNQLVIRAADAVEERTLRMEPPTPPTIERAHDHTKPVPRIKLG
jgi:hypothetical protein